MRSSSPQRPHWRSSAASSWNQSGSGAATRGRLTRRRDGEHAPVELAGVHVVEALLDVGEVVDLAHHLVEQQAAVEVEADEQRDVVVGPGGAVAAAEDRLVVVERVHHEAGLGAELRHAEQHQVAAPVEEVDRLADQGRVPDALEDVVDPVGEPEVLHRGDGVLDR